MATTQNKNTAKEAHETTVKVNDEASKSELASMMGQTKTITIEKGTPYEYKLTLQFPGVARASQIRDDIRDVFGNPRRSDFMEAAVKYLIVQPQIKSVDFWNTHRGFDEAANQIMDWFYKSINGDSDKSAD